ncbi:porin [Methylibium petroleiphilum]|uniref:porin n=1 Tax=Methylibium petroleiphilum TaxID=105560 RepID=UPI001AC5EF7E|nr:porin [Methylibium petroleiphilum]MBN9204638.1 porin [Methylibium petroleiphilum]
MKKSVLALAALGAFAGAASAQSSVTLYGRLDTAVTWTDSTIAEDRFTLNNHQPIGGSRWGLKGSEDLGGGLKANFTLESGFNSDDGSLPPSGKLFDRLAWVGLSSASLGEIRLGRHDTLTRQLNLGYGSDLTAEGEITVVDANFAAGTVPVPTGRVLFQNFGFRVDNSVVYLSPSFGGFQVRGLVAAGEGATARQQGVLLGYAAGPIKAGLSYEEYDDAPGGGGSAYNKVFTAGASYNFGVATVGLGYQNTSDFGSNTAESGVIDDVDAYNVGVLVPFGSFEFRAQYTHSKVDLDPGVGGGSNKNDKYGASLRYALSKRTTIYSAYLHRESDNDDAVNLNGKDQFLVGIGHNF